MKVRVNMFQDKSLWKGSRVIQKLELVEFDEALRMVP